MLFKLFIIASAVLNCYWITNATKENIFYLKFSAMIGLLVSTGFGLALPTPF